MEKENFDENQIQIRHKIAYQSWLITLVLVLINGIATSEYSWAPTIVQAQVIITLPVLYFVTMSILKNVYISKKIKNPFVTALFWVIIGIFNLSIVFVSYSKQGINYFFEDNYLNYGAVQVITGICFIYIGIIIFIKYFKRYFVV